MKSKFFLPISALGVLLLVTGCATSVTSIKPLTLSEVSDQRISQMTQEQKDGLIYDYATQGIMIKKSNLLTIQPSDLSNITSLLSEVNKNLSGVNNNALDSYFANFMLTEFARTPYEWTESSINPVGFDPATRQYFVDVTYTTTGRLKSVIPSSRIPLGSPNESQLEQARYDDYINYLSDLQKGSYGAANQALAIFEKYWGSISSVMQNQQNVSLLDRTFEHAKGRGIGKLTYSGLVANSTFDTGASMTFQFVFKYNYNLGNQTNLRVSSVYLKSFNLDNYHSLLDSLNQGTVTGTEVLRPFIDTLINEYNKALEEGNNEGLYSLFSNYASVDKYYRALNDYVYTTIGGYNFKVLSRSGTQVLVEVHRIAHFRAKDSDMTSPTYKETLVYSLALTSNNQIKITSVNLLNATLVGEPMSVIKDVSGVSNTILFDTQSFTHSNKVAVEKTLKEFSAAVFSGTPNSPAFAESVDDGVSTTNLTKMADYIESIPNATKKIEYIERWDTKTNVFVTVTVREIFELPDGTAQDTQARIDLANLAGSWKVVNYTRTLDVKMSNSNISTQGAFCVNTRS